MVLGAALTRAMREELIHRNVARLATLPPAPPARIQPWSADEARAFLAASRTGQDRSGSPQPATAWHRPGRAGRKAGRRIQTFRQLRRLARAGVHHPHW